jgi:hypothetical protein
MFFQSACDPPWRSFNPGGDDISNAIGIALPLEPGGHIALQRHSNA